MTKLDNNYLCLILSCHLVDPLFSVGSAFSDKIHVLFATFQELVNRPNSRCLRLQPRTLLRETVRTWVAIYDYCCNYNRHSTMSTPLPTIRAAGPSSRAFGDSAFTLPSSGRLPVGEEGRNEFKIQGYVLIIQELCPRAVPNLETSGPALLWADCFHLQFPLREFSHPKVQVLWVSIPTDQVNDRSAKYALTAHLFLPDVGHQSAEVRSRKPAIARSCT